jgi:sugar phosphate permease
MIVAVASADLQRDTVACVTRHIIPFVMLCFLVAFIDRSNISVAALAMNSALGMTAEQFGWGASLFFSAYILLEFPSNLILAHVGARRWIARIMMSWGVIASLMGLIQSKDQFYLVRILLGAAEAGFTPGVIYYLSRWYPSQSLFDNGTCTSCVAVAEAGECGQKPIARGWPRSRRRPSAIRRT